MASFASGNELTIPQPHKLLEIDTDAEFECPRKHGEEVLSSAWAPDGRTFAWSLGTSKVFILQTSSPTSDTSRPFDLLINPQAVREKKCLDCHGPVVALAFGCRSSDKKWHAGEVNYNRLQNFALGSVVLAAGLLNGDIKIWDIVSDKIMLVLRDHKKAITELSFSPDGSLVLASSSQDCTIKLWDSMDDGNMFHSLPHIKPVLGLAWSSNAQLIASVGIGKLVKLWNARSGKLEGKFEGHNNDVTSCAFSPDGAFLYTSSLDTRVICWEVATGEIRSSFYHMLPPPRPIFAGGVNGHEVRKVVASRDGWHIVTICNDGIVRVWDVSNATVPRQATRFPDTRVVSYSHNSFLFSVGSRRGSFRIYRAPMRMNKLRTGCLRTIRSSVPAEKVALLHLPRKVVQQLEHPQLA
ncbi:hypothetical protein RvY_14409 [Ramazzottius varieornatus]|uniref:Uncharacterized protein n=1 Tax=Ramazzottius varieornatus TaxID=947166 RepID=A0A1D1VV04_RAMVA|nr:hypothetical protein RvY_14409 [Ramazzottius varieornatus]